MNGNVRAAWCTWCAGKVTISWLATEAIRRYSRRKSPTSALRQAAEVRKTRGGALLDVEDDVVDVLDDNDFIDILLEGEVVINPG